MSFICDRADQISLAVFQKPMWQSQLVLAKVCWYLSFDNCGGTQNELEVLEVFGFGEKWWMQDMG